MKFLSPLLSVCLLLILAARAVAQDAEAAKPYLALARTLTLLQGLIAEQVPTATPCLEADFSLSFEHGGKTRSATASLAYQKNDKLWLALRHPDLEVQITRNGDVLTIYTPKKNFALIGRPDLPRWGGRALSDEDRAANRIPPLKWPLRTEQMLFLPSVVTAKFGAPETIGNVVCQLVEVVPSPQIQRNFDFTGRAWLRPDGLPARLEMRAADGAWTARLEIHNAALSAVIDPKRFEFVKSSPETRLEETAVAHLVRFAKVLPQAVLGSSDPDIRPQAAERVLIAREGEGYLERYRGTWVLHLKGTPEQMGWQHGRLLAPKIRDVCERILYGVGVGSSFEKGRWFFGEIEEAYARLAPFISDDYKSEAAALARGAGLEEDEVRLAQVFPELFHCSGFALYGRATVGGALYHGRVLDYMRGVGLEPNAVVIVHQPASKNAWVNIGYAGCIGTVTAMNEKKIAVGEMGGRGEGHWDGKPMAHLLREIMEEADTLEEAVEILRRGPRTCEYYYVISDAKTKQAVGIAATPSEFTVVRAGEANARLPRPFADAVLLSADQRYNALCDKVQQFYGRIDAAAAIELMRRPVAMSSNLHSVLFAPDTLDFWVAHASARNPACDNPYTRYNLAELLGPPPSPTAPFKD